MGRLRSLLRKVIKPAVMVFVAGGVALSLVVTTPSNAQAFVAPIIPPPVVAGALETALPVAAAITPAGWVIIGGVAIAAGLYYTKDYWLPYVTGTFGQPSDIVPPATGSPGPHPQTNWTLRPDPMTLTSGAAGQPWTGYSLTLTNNTNTANDIYWVKNIACKKNATGEVVVRYSGLVGARVNAGASQPILGSCDNYETMVGAIVGPECGIGDCGSQTVGHPGPVNTSSWGTLRPTAGSFDPKDPGVKYTTTVECIRADGSKFNLSKDSTGADGAVAVPSCAAVDPGAHGTGKMDVVGTPPATVGGAPQSLLSQPAQAPATDKPLCGPSLPGPGCKLQVLVDSVPCVMGSFDCMHWTNLSRDSTTSSRVSCQYGPYSVPVSTCNPLERAYEPGGAPATDANTDGDPSTRSDTDPNGQQIPKQSAGTGTGTATGTVPGVAGTPDPANPDAQQCFPGGWAMLNPMWIVDGIKCSFIPKTDIKQRVTTLQDLSKTKAPISWISPNITGPGQAGCPNWIVNIGGVFSENVVCGQGFTNAILSVRYPMFGLISAAMVWPLLRSLWYAAIPVMRVAPSSGGKD